MKKIGLFGGSFNPIHNGHLALAGLAVNYLELDILYFIPTADHPFFKESLSTSFDERLQMIKLITDNIPYFDTYDGESKREGPSYAITTIEEFEKTFQNSQLFYLIGADNIDEFHKWHKYEEILSKVTLTITSRPGFQLSLPKHLQNKGILELPSPEWGLSSSKVRTYLQKKYSCLGLIPKEVQNYIETNKLYS